MNERFIQILEDKEWIEGSMEDLKANDVFRMFESTGDLALGAEGNAEWLVEYVPNEETLEGDPFVEIIPNPEEDVLK